MNEFYIRNVVEAALLAAGKSLQLPELGQVFEEGARPQAEEIRAALEALAAEYSSRGVEIKETAAGFRIQVRKEFATEISRLWPERPAKYSRALLETLALIAYRQPITRAEIEAVRGVAVNPNILKTVIERNWVRVVGHRDVPGRPELLGTTREFLDYFGLRSLDALPPLAELKAMGEYNLQLELPNAGALGIESRGDAAAGGELGGGLGSAEVAGVAVAGLLVAEFAGTGVAGLAADVLFADVGAANAESTGDGATFGGDAAGSEAAGAEAAASARDATAADVDVVSAGFGEADDADAEADRTLSVEFAVRSGETANADAADSDDSEAADTAASDKPTGALGDAGTDDDEDEEDELSADGHDSRELVAAPRDVDD